MSDPKEQPAHCRASWNDGECAWLECPQAKKRLPECPLPWSRDEFLESGEE